MINDEAVRQNLLTISATTTTTTTTIATMSPRERPQLDTENTGSSSSSSSSSSLILDKKIRHSVRFSDVKVREYNRVLGNHPEATNGVPISLGWEFVEGVPTPLSEYESNRPTRRRNLRLSSLTRKNLLVNVFQVDEKEIIEANNELKRIRKQRDSSNKQGRIGAHVESALTSTRRKFRKTFFSRDELFQGFAVASGIPLSAY
jgi:hypothetical protein